MSKSIVVGNYTISGVLGSGSFATVYRAVNRVTGEDVAIKAVSTRKLDKKALANLESEISILQGINHPNVVRLLDVQKTEKFFYLVFEFCAGGDLSRYIQSRGPFPEDHCRKLMQQLAKGLEFMWMKHLIHRDLKPQNILLSSDAPDATLKIADFGFARHLEAASLADTLCGSPLYMAPEILRYQRYDAKADLWSVGAILFEMLTKRPPFTGANHLELLANIERRDAVLPPDIVVSKECKQFLDCLLRRNPHMRMSFQEFFSSPFLQTPHDPEASATNSAESSELLAQADGGSAGEPFAGALAAVGAHLFASQNPPPPLPASFPRPEVPPSLSSVPSLPPSIGSVNSGGFQSFGGSRERQVGLTAAAPLPQPIDTRPSPPLQQGQPARLMSPPRDLAVFGVGAVDDAVPPNAPPMITLSTRLPAAAGENPVCGDDDDSPSVGATHRSDGSEFADSVRGDFPEPPSSPGFVVVTRATPRRSSPSDTPSHPNSVVQSPPRLQKLGQRILLEPSGESSSPQSVLQRVLETTAKCRAIGQHATTVVTLATCYCQYYKLVHGSSSSRLQDVDDNTFGLSAPDARHMLLFVIRELLTEGDEGVDFEGRDSVTASQMYGSARVVSAGFVDPDVIAAYTTPADIRQLRYIDMATTCALSLYLKSCQLLETGLTAAATALASPQVSTALSAASANVVLETQLAKAVQYLGDVKDWLLACAKRCMKQCEASFGRLPPQDDLPAVSAVDVLTKSALCLARLGLGKDVLSSFQSSGSGSASYQTEAKQVYAQSSLLLKLLLTIPHEVAPVDAQSLRTVCGLIDGRLQEWEGTLQPSPYVDVAAP